MGMNFFQFLNFFFHSLGVKEVRVRFDEKSVVVILDTKNSSDGLHHSSKRATGQLRTRTLQKHCVVSVPLKGKSNIKNTPAFPVTCLKSLKHLSSRQESVS